MFSGIVEELGELKVVAPSRLVVAACKVMDDLALGSSICVNGACLTVTSRDSSSFAVDVVPETLRRTNLGSLKVTDRVNLERSLPVGGRFDGHIVQGHIDGTGTVQSISDEGVALLLKFQAPTSLMHYVVEKGFIAVDGTSLTVVNCDTGSFVVTLVPYTRDNTVLGIREVGEHVNLEIDILAKYVERLLSGRNLPLGVAGDI